MRPAIEVRFRWNSPFSTVSFGSNLASLDRQKAANSGLSRSYSNLGSRLKQMRKMCVRSQDEAGVIASTALPKLKITLHNTVIGMTRDHASKANSAD